MAVSPREPYISYALHHENKRLIGLYAGAEQEQRDQVARALAQVIWRMQALASRRKNSRMDKPSPSMRSERRYRYLPSCKKPPF